MKLSTKESFVLNILSGGRELYGLQIVSESAGLLGRGTVYVTLARMIEKGLVKSRREPTAKDTLPRHLYRSAVAT